MIQTTTNKNAFWGAIFSIILGMLLLGMTPQVFAWGGPSHSELAQILFNDSNISPFISEFGINVGDVTSWTSEPPDEWHHPGWAMLVARGYLGTYGSQNWAGLNETTRLRYLTHIAVDCGVPIGHSPASDTYTNKVAEAHLEAQVATWSSYPSIAGTCYFQHGSTGYSTCFDGTYTQIISKFYSACLNNANWYEGKENWLGLHSTDTNRTAAWAGTTLGLNLGRAILVDYFLAKRNTVAVANGPYSVSPGGSITFSSAGSYDPDSITWNANATYYNNGGGLTTIQWDLNGDGVYETSGASPTLTYSALYALGGPTTGRTISLRVVDDEGKVATATSTLTVYAPSNVLISPTLNNGSFESPTVIPDGTNGSIAWQFIAPTGWTYVPAGSSGAIATQTKGTTADGTITVTVPNGNQHATMCNGGWLYQQLGPFQANTIYILTGYGSKDGNAIPEMCLASGQIGVTSSLPTTPNYTFVAFPAVVVDTRVQTSLVGQPIQVVLRSVQADWATSAALFDHITLVAVPPEN